MGVVGALVGAPVGDPVGACVGGEVAAEHMSHTETRRSIVTLMRSTLFAILLCY